MVDIPLLRKRAVELAEGRLSRDGAAICLNAALDEIEELRAMLSRRVATAVPCPYRDSCRQGYCLRYGDCQSGPIGDYQSMRPTIVISAFPGTGKTHFATHSTRAILDSDSTSYSWVSEGVRNPDFPVNYIAHIKENIGKADAVLVSSHKEVRTALVAADIRFVLVYPAIDLKEEYLERYRRRGSAQAFINLLGEKWEDWIFDCIAQEGCFHLMLESGEFLSDKFQRYAKITVPNNIEATTTDCPDCPDCGLGPCATDPTGVTSATPRCYRPGYCGEPGEMSRPQVSALVDGQPYPLWDAVQMRTGPDIRSCIKELRELRQRTHEAKGGKTG